MHVLNDELCLVGDSLFHIADADRHGLCVVPGLDCDNGRLLLKVHYGRYLDAGRPVF